MNKKNWIVIFLIVIIVSQFIYIQQQNAKQNERQKLLFMQFLDTDFVQSREVYQGIHALEVKQKEDAKEALITAYQDLGVVNRSYLRNNVMNFREFDSYNYQGKWSDAERFIHYLLMEGHYDEFPKDDIERIKVMRHGFDIMHRYLIDIRKEAGGKSWGDIKSDGEIKRIIQAMNKELDELPSIWDEINGVPKDIRNENE
ncbi:hypothetical protein [Pontibacillus sp. HMF3514]|uniref:hypothetical protein n=1 Tax=Pontibacillus sp. HMF3514 TaxID=2692425 RepID=UPI00132036A8|nr:hypothetical protein [Pontibacillus sp. HMF3514]QHE51801.1 hypothetical protein GS400_07015 [Pontibacillus sp. HMF3514]